MHPSQHQAYEHSTKTRMEHTEKRPSDSADEEAMSHIRALKDAGFSPEEVEQMMREEDSGNQPSGKNAPVTAVEAAPMQIPGM